MDDAKKIDMNYRTTFVLAAIGAVILGAVLFLPPATHEEESVQGAKLLKDVTVDDITRIGVRRRGEVETLLEKRHTLTQSLWRIVKPLDRPSQGTAVSEILWRALALRGDAVLPSEARQEFHVYGLDNPRLSLSIDAKGKSTVFRFGKASDLDKSRVYFQREGDPNIYLSSREDYDHFDLSVKDLRDRKLVEFDHFRIVKILLKRKIVRVDGGGQHPDVEETEMEFKDEADGRKGWILTRHAPDPFVERLDEIKVYRITTELGNMTAEDFVPKDDESRFGLNDPEQAIQMFQREGGDPLEVRFGSFFAKDNKPEERRIYAHVVGTNEVAIVEAAKFDGIPKGVDQLRSDVLFDMTSEEIETLEIATPFLRLLLERREEEQKKEDGGTEKKVLWNVKEPPGIETEPGAVEHFVQAILMLRVKIDEKTTGFFPNVDPKTVGIDKDNPSVRVLFNLKRRNGTREALAFLLGAPRMDDDIAYLKKEWLDREVYAVPMDAYRALLRQELNFRKRIVFEVPIENIREYWVDTRETLFGKEVQAYYGCTYEENNKRWVFCPPHEGRTVDADENRSILALLHRIETDGYVTRDPGEAKALGLDRPETTVRILYEEEVTDSRGEKRKERRERKLIVGANVGKSNAGVYYASFLDGEGVLTGVVFLIHTTFVEALKRMPEKS